LTIIRPSDIFEALKPVQRRRTLKLPVLDYFPPPKGGWKKPVNKNTVYVRALSRNPLLDHQRMWYHMLCAHNHLLPIFMAKFKGKFPEMICRADRLDSDHSFSLTIWEMPILDKQTLGDKLLRRWYKLKGDPRYMCKPWCHKMELDDAIVQEFFDFLKGECAKYNLEVNRVENQKPVERIVYKYNTLQRFILIGNMSHEELYATVPTHCEHAWSKNRPLEFEIEIADHTPFLKSAAA